MANVLIAVHVVAALLLIGPITVAASRFPRQAKIAVGSASPAALAVATELHRVTRGYAAASVVIPVLGVGVASYEHMFGQRWLIVSIVLTAGAAALLAGLVVPAQSRALQSCRDQDAPAGSAAAARAAAGAGVFGVLWVAVAVLMVLQPRLGQ